MGLTGLVRLREVGVVILIENVRYDRDVVNGVEVVTERWVAVGRVTGENRYAEAFEECARLNMAIAEALRESQRMAGGAGPVEGLVPRKPQRSRRIGRNP